MVVPEAICDVIARKIEYRVFIEVESYQRKDLKSYCKGRKWDTIVDCRTFTLNCLLKEIGLFYQWGAYQEAKISHLCDSGQFINLSTDAELSELVESNSLSRQLRFYVNVVDCEARDIVVQQGAENEAPSDTNKNNQVCEVRDILVHQGAENEAPCNTNTNNQVQKKSAWQAMFWDDDPAGVLVERNLDEDEPIGVEEEHLYGVGNPPSTSPNKTFFLDVPNNHDPAAVPDEELPRNEQGRVVPEYVHDREDPTFEVGATFVDSDTFKLAMRQHAIKREFEVDVIYSDRKKYKAKCCSSVDCQWFIRAKKMKDSKTFTIMEIGDEHSCISTSKITGKMASQAWIADRGQDIMIEEPNIGPRKLQDRLEKKYNVKLGYGKVWNGRQKALDGIHGSWNDSFEGLWRFKAAVEKANPGSIVDIDVKTRGGKPVFNRVFVALKPCIDGFLKGCRPYLGCDSTFLNGRYTGQLAAATAIDGHNWLFPVAYGVFDKETTDNWEWFMQRLQHAIGTPPGLVIHTDAGKGLESAVSKVFNAAVEHRECFKHLIGNFKKKYRGDIIDKNMWQAAWTYVPEDYVHEYFSVARFKMAYESSIIPLGDKEQWPQVDMGYKVLPPKLGRSAGRPRVTRIKSSSETGTRSNQCSRCKGFGHHAKNCKEPEWQEGDNLPVAERETKKRKRKEPAVIVSSSQPAAPVTSSQPEGTATSSQPAAQVSSM